LYSLVVHISKDSVKASEGLIVKVSMKKQSLKNFHILGGGKFDKNFIARDSSSLAFVEPKDSIAMFTVIEDIPGSVVLRAIVEEWEDYDSIYIRIKRHPFEVPYVVIP
jgi:hypothetical protein